MAAHLGGATDGTIPYSVICPQRDALLCTSLSIRDACVGGRGECVYCSIFLMDVESEATPVALGSAGLAEG